MRRLDTQRALEPRLARSRRGPSTPTAETPAEIDESFDAIAYEKGAAVLRMVEGYVGAETFRHGINAYLEAHAYGNATSEDFWTTLTAVSGKPVDRILPTFVNQPGVPLVDVSLVVPTPTRGRRPSPAAFLRRPRHGRGTGRLAGPGLHEDTRAATPRRAR